ncbi:helix-turn-helix domain-containing protein [Streptomyces lanatus]|uniref:Helix-turn-helix domain-containing protein n=1 Tax=Streptomyces lanatus TaxID=66900 RepID=A0ABV1XVP1_9ACTN|nr:helix-turn-helix domain-containing protein [Streptomyces lanatus]
MLRACGDSDTALTLAELALRTGLPKPTAHRLTAELVRLGLVERNPDGRRSAGRGSPGRCRPWRPRALRRSRRRAPSRGRRRSTCQAEPPSSEMPLSQSRSSALSDR